MRNFKVQLSKALTSLLWKQWEKLGIAVWTYENIPWRWLIDLEALVFATSLLKEEDRRLFHVMQIWLGHYRRLLHAARLKRLWKNYIEYAKQMKIPALNPDGIPGKPLRAKKERVAEVLTTPHWEDSSLLWLKLRAFLGAGVRSDTMVYFLYHDIGTTFSIAREMFIDQKSVHDVLRIWESVGWLRRFGQRRGYTVSPNFRNRILSMLEISGIPPRFNIGRVFIGILLVRGAIQRFEEHQSDYLLSSHFRDIAPLLQELWEQTGVTMPAPSSFPGKAYIPVFLNALLEAWGKIGHSTGGIPELSKGEVLTHSKIHTGGEIMGFTERDMYESAYRTLRRRYPTSKGWRIIPQFVGANYRPDFVVERKDFWGTIHRVIAEVKAECRITQAHIDQLNAYARALAGRNAVVDEKILIVPAGVDASVVPRDITVIYLRGFKCSEG